MELFSYIDAIHDNNNKLIILKAYVPLIGLKATALLMHLNTTIDNGFRVERDQDGFVWHRQNIKWMCRQSTLSEYGLRKAKECLLELGLIHVKYGSGMDRTVYWRVDKEKLTRFFAFAHALYAATRPENEYTLPQWHAFLKNHPDIVEEFRHLYPRLSQFDPDKQPRKVNAKNLMKQPVQHKSTQSKKSEDIKTRPCRFVEHWNAQNSTPKCKIGTKAYEMARRFFAAYSRYEAGNCNEFMLSSDEQQRIRLDKINRIPQNAPCRGPKKIPVRPDEQMFRHIELAARAYQKEYTPRRKELLPKSLPAFLFNAYSKRYGACSIFLERVGIFRSKPIDESDYDAMLQRASPQELDTVSVIKQLYDYANDRAQDKELSMREFKTALDISRKIIEQYNDFDMDTHIIASHFRYYDDFLQWFSSYAEDEIWRGMPITALSPGKDLWRRFIDFVCSDIGVDVFTGERVN